MGLQGTRLGAFRAYFFGFFVCTAGFLFGYDTGIVGMRELYSYTHTTYSRMRANLYFRQGAFWNSSLTSMILVTRIKPPSVR